jgi:hypothetical protein
MTIPQSIILTVPHSTFIIVEMAGWEVRSGERIRGVCGKGSKFKGK